MSRDLLCGLSLVLFFAAWYAPGVFGGQVYYAEDIANYFLANRGALYDLAHGGAFSWWDPLPGLGMPRLGNIQTGYLTPLSSLFYALPPTEAFRFYPPLALGVLALFCFALFRAKGVGPIPALFGALAFSTLGNVATHVQQPPVLDTLVWLPATLLAWEYFARTGRGIYASLAGLGFAFQCTSGFPQYLLYNGLLMVFWMASTLYETRRERARFLRNACAIAAIGISGLCLASFQLLPGLELIGDSNRSLLSAAGGFADSYRVTPAELPLALAAESFLVQGAPVLEHGAPYPHLPNLSLLVLAFALLAAFRAPTRRGTWALALLFLVGMLGREGGVTPLLGAIMPFADQIRGPIRMIVPAGFLLAWLGAWGMQGWLAGGGRARLAGGLACCAWIAVLAFALRWPQERWVEPSAFEIPAAIAEAQPRLALDRRHSRGAPPFAVNAGLLAHRPTLLLYEPVWPRNYFEAIFASQFGGLDETKRLEETIARLILPLREAELPLLRAFRLETLVRYGRDGYETRQLPGAMDRFSVVEETLSAPQPRQRWRLAASKRWDPRRQVIVEERIPAAGSATPRAEGAERNFPSPPRIRVLGDSADHQLLEVESSGGVLITSELFYPGWQVQVDGTPSRPLQVNLALRGVFLTPGRHRVEWRYRPTWLWRASAATSLGALILVALPAALRSGENGKSRGATRRVSGFDKGSPEVS